MKKSFTIIELVFVIVIIGILAAMALPRFVGVQNDALVSVEKSAIGAARQSLISFNGWAILHPKESNITVEIYDERNQPYNCAVIFSDERYPITVTAKQKGVDTDNNCTIGSSTHIGEYRTLAPLMLDPSTIKDWNSTRVDARFENLNGPASNFVDDELSEIHQGMYWRYDNTNGFLVIKK
ncbi:type II secretion system protein [Nitrosophilus kaiyonis]|uniref:type II secretion system protein n=1 Tax=Nitrosophilus kaiyonis TaxID=2930200 RepID=UPI002490FE1D|nr:type II secretion system protein [Nitrosophilus kaiyonis]